MVKMITLSGMFLLSLCSIANSAEFGIKVMNIGSAEIITGASSYKVFRGYNDFDNTIYCKPRAIFLSYYNSPVGAVEFDKWNVESERALDKLIDPTAKTVAISTVEIGGWVPQIGSVIAYYDTEGKHIRYDAYNGPTDIKNARNYYGLIKPHVLLKDVKTVTVRSGLGYHKSTITYDDMGHMKETTTLKHKIVVGTQISLAALAVILVIKNT